VCGETRGLTRIVTRCTAGDPSRGYVLFVSLSSCTALTLLSWLALALPRPRLQEYSTGHLLCAFFAGATLPLGLIGAANF